MRWFLIVILLISQTLFASKVNWDRVIKHVKDKVNRAEVRLDPCPHILIEDIFPDDFYELLCEKWPADEEFAPLLKGRNRLSINSLMKEKKFAKDQEFWSRFNQLDNQIIKPVIIKKYLPYVHFRHDIDSPSEIKTFKISRQPGYLTNDTVEVNCPTHLDGSSLFCVCLYYTPKTDDYPKLGTRFYRGPTYQPGNKGFKGEKLESYIQLKQDQVIASDILNQDLYWMNRNPFRRTEAIYVPGEELGTTDVELLTSDRFPLRIYGGIDNTGNDITGNNRFFAGFNYGQLFGSDHRLAYQYSTSTDFKRFQAHTLFYEAPLPWRHYLIIYGGYSYVDADFAVPNVQGRAFHTHGWDMQASLRYDIPLKPNDFLLHEFTWGFDFKRTNNNLDFGGRPVISQTNVNLTQFMIGYSVGFETKEVTSSFEIEGFYSPGKWVADQSNDDYNSLRPFAKSKYIYARSAFTLIYRFYKEWAVHNYFRGQIASINLLPSEEYGIGGYNTVRGYKERIVNGDYAFIWNLELRTPSVSPLDYKAGWKKLNDDLQFLIFCDYGWEKVKRAAAGQRKRNHLISIGPGVRYNIVPYVTFRADWGFQLHDLDLGGPYQRLHFSLSIGY